MIILGLTGGIGAGKTFVASLFEISGIPVYNSDLRAKILMVKNSTIKKGLTEKFGNDVYKNGELNRKLIADIIFADKNEIDWINQLVHPIVQTDFENWAHKQSTTLVIKEAAILIESGAYKQCNKIAVVTAPEKLRIERVAQRDNMTPENIKLRLNNQLTEKERLKHADYIIVNDGIELVNVQVEKIIKDLVE